MSCLRWCTRRGTLRALMAVLLLAGVFAMHGLTGNHDAAMAVGPATPGTSHSVSHEPTMLGVSGQVDSSLKLTARPDGHGHIHAMDDVCLGMLIALLLALIAALTRRSLTAAHPVHLPSSPVLVAIDDPSPPWRRPVLSKLCVLRT